MKNTLSGRLFKKKSQGTNSFTKSGFFSIPDIQPNNLVAEDDITDLLCIPLITDLYSTQPNCAH